MFILTNTAKDFRFYPNLMFNAVIKLYFLDISAAVIFLLRIEFSCVPFVT